MFLTLDCRKTYTEILPVLIVFYLSLKLSFFF